MVRQRLRSAAFRSLVCRPVPVPQPARLQPVQAKFPPWVQQRERPPEVQLASQLLGAALPPDLLPSRQLASVTRARRHSLRSYRPRLNRRKALPQLFRARPKALPPPSADRRLTDQSGDCLPHSFRECRSTLKGNAPPGPRVCPRSAAKRRRLSFRHL